MRMKTTLIIIVVTFVITAANFGSNLFFTRHGLRDEAEQEISVTLNIAEELVSTKISLLSSNAETVAERLVKAKAEEMEAQMREQLYQFPDFNALTVFNREGITSEYGELPSAAEWLLENGYIQSAFEGKTAVLVSNYDNETSRFVMHFLTPMGKDNILSVAIPATVFENMFTGFSIWKTGNIFILNENGVLIWNYDTGLVNTGAHFLNIPELAKSKENTNFFNEMMLSNTGFGNYSYNNQAQMCAYKLITGPKTGW